MFVLVFLACCAGSGLCDELVTRSGESYRVWESKCVWSRHLKIEAAWATDRLLPHKKKKKPETRQISNDRCNRLCQQFCIHLSEQEQQARYVIFAFLQNIHSECCCTIHRQRDKPLGTPHTVLWALSTLFTLSDIDCACRYQTFDIFQPSQMTIRWDVT